jgi:hypothetical protein
MRHSVEGPIILLKEPCPRFTIPCRRIHDFKIGGGGAHLKKLRRAEEGAKLSAFTSMIILHDIESNIRLFADDCVCYRRLREASNRHK